MDHEKTVLFICTGNYYRSRLAEEIFNCYASKNLLPSRADSAGLRVHETRNFNPGTFSPYALSALKRFEVVPSRHESEPKALSEALLEHFQLSIGLSFEEHKPMMLERFPDYADKISYWNIGDVADEAPELATQRILEQTLKLIETMN